MDYSNIKLIVSDLDGTLLNSKGEVSNRFFEQFKILQDYNVHFAIASGRQYYSILNKFKNIKKDITIIAENGGIVKRNDKILQRNYFSTEDAYPILKQLKAISDAYIVLCGEKSAYIESRNSSFETVLKQYYSEYIKVDDILKVRDDNFLKIAIYSFSEVEQSLYPHFKHYENALQVKVSGNNWLDISHINTNKGFALQQLQKEFQCDSSETIVFGDYNNDIEMLERSDFSFAMDNAHPNVKRIAKYKTKSNDEGGVEYILERIITDKKALFAKSC